tara:strand:- start:2562 stop:3314 length:753 start_codon:yes stop_codon:yes gene_type:complete
MIIAEIGLNHLGLYKRANLYVKKLLTTEIDAITLQVRESAYYTGTRQSYLLEQQDYERISKLIHSKNKKFGIAIADATQIDFFESIKVDFYKVIRNDMLNDYLIEKLVNTNKKIIVSTGTCSDIEIEEFIAKYKDANITINHTQLSYDIEDCNLSAISRLHDQYKINVSYGNHCSNHKVLYMAPAYKPSDILFYVKGFVKHLSWQVLNEPWPDDEHAILITNVKQLAYDLKILSKAIGTGDKHKMEIKIK